MESHLRDKLVADWAAQGLPPTVEDNLVLARLARLWLSQPEQPATPLRKAS